MGTVAQHQLSTFSSPVNGTSPIDANTVRGNDNSIKTSYNAHDADTTIHLQNGAVASRPAASVAGQTWLASDTNAVYLWLDTGSAWVEANYLRSTGGTISGPVTISDTTDASNATTGALIVSGGVGIAKKLYVGSTLTVVAGGLTVTSGTSALQAVTATTGVFSSTLSAAGVTSSSGLTVSSGTSALQAATVTTLAVSTTSTFTGIPTMSSGLVVGTTSIGGSAGGYNFNTGDGIQQWARTGSVYDWALLTPGGSYIARVPTGTVNVSLLGTLTTASTLTVTAGGLTVSSGTSALQALTATSVTTTGDVAIANGQVLRMKTSGGTAQAILFVDGTDKIQMDSSGLGVTMNGTLKIVSSIGFYNTAPAAKQTVTGSKGANAALASLMTALAAIGLVTDSTT